MNISIIIFCYNERDNLAKTIEQATSVLPSISKNYEIIIVNDGSTDDTVALAMHYTDKFTFIEVVSHPQNMGIGQALRTGYNRAQFEYVCAIPGDGQFDVSELKAIQPFNQSAFYSFYRTHTNYNSYRKALTWLNRLFNQHVLGMYLRDVNWIKVYRKEQLSMVNTELTSSLVESEICAKLYRHGVLPIEIPSAYLERKFGVSRGGGWKTLSKAILDLFFLFWVVVTYQPSEKLD